MEAMNTGNYRVSKDVCRVDTNSVRKLVALEK